MTEYENRFPNPELKKSMDEVNQELNQCQQCLVYKEQRDRAIDALLAMLKRLLKSAKNREKYWGGLLTEWNDAQKRQYNFNKIAELKRQIDFINKLKDTN